MTEAKTQKIKIHQKLGLDAFKQLQAQLKEKGFIEVVNHNPSIEYLSVGGYVKSVFNLGKKLEVVIEPPQAFTDYHFTRRDGKFILQRIAE